VLQTSRRQKDEQGDDETDGDESGRGEDHVLMVGRETGLVPGQRLMRR
jgi:hypothetical protein